mgnify:CR=1 FL=1
MGKFIAQKYYTLLLITVVYFIFNLLIRDELINWIFNTSSDQSVTDAEAYAKETLVRDVFSYFLLILMVLIALVSIVLLFIKEGRAVNRIVLFAVPIFVAYCLFLGLISGSFS